MHAFVFVLQARHVEGGSAGLIPSQMLEEKRKAFVKRDVELAPAGNWKKKNNGNKEIMVIINEEK